MKIGVLTFHFPYNCGASLQCYALTKYLKQHGAEVEVINYRPWYHQNRYTPFRNPWQAAKEQFVAYRTNGGLIKAFLLGVHRYLGIMKSWTRYKKIAVRDEKFQSFIKQYFNETQVYRTIGQLQKKHPKCDAYICGSDQIWNTRITDKAIDRAYFLDFGASGIKKFSYAVSANFPDFEQNKEELAGLLKDFQVVSLRENTWEKEIKSVVGNRTRTQIDVDPTLLLDKDAYLQLIPEKKLADKKFVLTYTMPDETAEKVTAIAKRIAREQGICVIDISGSPTDRQALEQNTRICGPEDFLWYMEHADYVVTNSFHGTVFSIIFQKKFVTVPYLPTSYRIKHLLESMELSHRETYDIDYAMGIINEEISYDEVTKRIAAYRTSSQVYLENIIAGNL